MVNIAVGSEYINVTVVPSVPHPLAVIITADAECKDCSTSLDMLLCNYRPSMEIISFHFLTKGFVFLAT